jgi:hypothetical protein
MFAITSCQNENQPNTQPESEEAKIVNNLIEQCSDFDSNALSDNILGEWDTDSILFYDEEWKDIENDYQLMGVYNPNVIGGSEIRRYTFEADGTGTYYSYSKNDGLDDFSAPYNWTYNAENKTLTLNGQYNHGQYTVSGFNGEYLILDSVNARGENMREIFKRKMQSNGQK